ncbi:hypothetical protein Pan44_16570 [Caulifigura coniformis]|uniref:PHP domain protein n=1 Tax=Caulifigura coniformis TaxID=2527983 RepID=A0A517SC03_9PLAN|nr:hypothetical protein [Caulifigura coniformis]QDT53634.1 hypothetical protein Pan44_16570 [Caulifigura coniformis]
MSSQPAQASSPSGLKAVLVVPVVLATLVLGLKSVIPAQRQPAATLESDTELRWFKGNVHTHSHWSDGNDYLETIALWYRDRGYNFLTFTDHNVLANVDRWVEIDKTKGGRVAFDKLKAKFPDWVETRTEDGKEQVRLRRFDEVSAKLNVEREFLLIQGEELSDFFASPDYGKLPLHINAGNIYEKLAPAGGSSVAEVIQNNVDSVNKQRERTGQVMMVHLNHPNFGWAVRAEDLMRIIGERFFEVYNGHPGVNNKGNAERASTEKIWDIVLTKRLAELRLPVMYGLAVDDGHDYHNIPSRKSEPGRGWVMVLAPKLTATSLILALEAGQFYASSGVSLKKVESSDRGLSIEIDPVAGETYTIEFIGTRKGYNPVGTPVMGKDGKPLNTTHRYSDEIGTSLAKVEGNSARYDFKGDEIYVRATITSSALHPNPSEVGDFQQAWVQPVLGPACPPQND